MISKNRANIKSGRRVVSNPKSPKTKKLSEGKYLTERPNSSRVVHPAPKPGKVSELQFKRALSASRKVTSKKY